MKARAELESRHPIPPRELAERRRIGSAKVAPVLSILPNCYGVVDDD